MGGIDLSEHLFSVLYHLSIIIPLYCIFFWVFAYWKWGGTFGVFFIACLLLRDDTICVFFIEAAKAWGKILLWGIGFLGDEIFVVLEGGLCF